jgi:hypothetical protein
LRLRSISGRQQTLPFNGNDTNPEIFRTIMNPRSVFEQQQPNLPLETNLFRADAIRQARERGCSHLYDIILMLTFILINYNTGLYLVCVLLWSGFVTFSNVVFATYRLIRRWITNNIYQGRLLIMVFSSLLSYGISLFLECVSDSWIIFPFALMIFLLGCSSRASLDSLEIFYMINDTASNFILLSAGVRMRV